VTGDVAKQDAMFIRVKATALSSRPPLSLPIRLLEIIDALSRGATAIFERRLSMRRSAAAAAAGRTAREHQLRTFK